VEKAAAGAVALVVSPTAPTGQFQRPGAVGAAAGAMEGAAAGAVAPLVPGWAANVF